MHQQVRPLDRFSISRRHEHADLDKVVQRNLRLDARFIDQHLARTHVERHTPFARPDPLRLDSLRRELPVGVRLEQVRKQITKLVGRDRLKLTVEVERRRQRGSRGAVSLEEAAQRGVHPLGPDVLAQRVQREHALAVPLEAVGGPQ